MGYYYIKWAGILKIYSFNITPTPIKTITTNIDVTPKSWTV